MSFLFDGTNDQLRGEFAGSAGVFYDTPCTLGAWFKYTTHPAQVKNFLAVGASVASEVTSIKICTGAGAHEWNGVAANSAGTLGTIVITSVTAEATWGAVMMVLTSTAQRDYYVLNTGNTAQQTTSRDMGGLLRYIAVGENIIDGQDFAGRVAEVAFWNAALNSTEIGQYLSGTAASLVNPTKLQLYVPMATNDLSNIGLDSNGDLTASGNAVFDADHPTINNGSSKKTHRRSLMGVG